MSDANKTQWTKKRMDRMLVEHFLRGGYYNTAMKLAQYSDIEVSYITFVIYLLTNFLGDM